MDGLDSQLAAIAARQHCLITLRDVRAVGGNAKHAQQRVATGRWEFVFDGVYRLAGVPWTWDARVMALVLAGGPDAVASHLCACRLHGLGFGTALPEVSVPRSRNFRWKNHLIRTSTDLDRCSVVKRNGIPTTDPARTLLDVGRFVGATLLTSTVSKARKKGLVDWHDLAVCVAVHARRGRHGTRALREVIAAGAANDGISDTDSELIALSVLREHGIEEPVLQHRIRDAAGELLAEMDLAYPDRLVDFEINGTIHLLPEVIVKDEERDEMLRRMGWTVRRIWWEIPVKQPKRFIAIIRDTLKAASTDSCVVSRRRPSRNDARNPGKDEL